MAARGKRGGAAAVRMVDDAHDLFQAPDCLAGAPRAGVADRGELLAQSKQQIKQLQQEVAVLRPLAVRAARHVTQPSPASKALSQMLDSAPAPARPTLPPDGFADTLPSLQFTNESL
jgi:hypothetical protein